MHHVVDSTRCGCPGWEGSRRCCTHRWRRWRVEPAQCPCPAACWHSTQRQRGTHPPSACDKHPLMQPLAPCTNVSSVPERHAITHLHINTLLPAQSGREQQRSSQLGRPRCAGARQQGAQVEPAAGRAAAPAGAAPGRRAGPRAVKQRRRRQRRFQRGRRGRQQQHAGAQRLVAAVPPAAVRARGRGARQARRRGARPGAPAPPARAALPQHMRFGLSL